MLLALGTFLSVGSQTGSHRKNTTTLLGPRKDRFHRIGGFCVHARDAVRVGIERQSDRRMPEHLLDDLRVRPGLQEQ